MSQPSYSRLEHSDRRCEQHIERLAVLFKLSMADLRNYGSQQQNHPVNSVLERQVVQQKALITAQIEEISLLRAN